MCSSLRHIHRPLTAVSQLSDTKAAHALIYGFCRAMLCISAVDRERPLRGLSLSVTFMYCVKTSNHILKLFSPSGRPTITYRIKRTLWQFRLGPRYWGKVATFNQYLALASMTAGPANVNVSMVVLGYSTYGGVCWSRETDDEVPRISKWQKASTYVTLKTWEQNLIVRTSKSKAAVTTNNIRLRSRYWSVEAWSTKHHAASVR